MKRENWKVFINCGPKEELEFVKAQTFKTKAEAVAFCKSNELGLTYPLKCVMTESEYNKRIFHM